MKKTLARHREVIEKAMKQEGPYTHNIISLALRMIAEELGKDVANGLVREYQLDDMYGIPEEK